MFAIKGFYLLHGFSPGLINYDFCAKLHWLGIFVLAPCRDYFQIPWASCSAFGNIAAYHADIIGHIKAKDAASSRTRAAARLCQFRATSSRLMYFSGLDLRRSGRGCRCRSTALVISLQFFLGRIAVFIGFGLGHGNKWGKVSCVPIHIPFLKLASGCRATPLVYVLL